MKEQDYEKSIAQMAQCFFHVKFPLETCLFYVCALLTHTLKIYSWN